MGSPLSPIIADMVLNTLIGSVLQQLPFQVPYIRKYVDDLFLALPHDQIQTTLTAFNKYHGHLQFTVEEERQARLPFLDMTVIGEENQ